VHIYFTDSVDLAWD